jgi:hypothetical protein
VEEEHALQPVVDPRESRRVQAPPSFHGAVRPTRVRDRGEREGKVEEVAMVIYRRWRDPRPWWLQFWRVIEHAVAVAEGPGQRRPLESSAANSCIIIDS